MHVAPPLSLKRQNYGTPATAAAAGVRAVRPSLYSRSGSDWLGDDDIVVVDLSPITARFSLRHVRSCVLAGSFSLPVEPAAERDTAWVRMGRGHAKGPETKVRRRKRRVGAFGLFRARRRGADWNAVFAVRLVGGEDRGRWMVRFPGSSSGAVANDPIFSLAESARATPSQLQRQKLLDHTARSLVKGKARAEPIR